MLYRSSGKLDHYSPKELTRTVVAEQVKIVVAEQIKIVVAEQIKIVVAELALHKKHHMKEELSSKLDLHSSRIAL